MPGKRIVIKLSQDDQHRLETYVSQGKKMREKSTVHASYFWQTKAER